MSRRVVDPDADDLAPATPAPVASHPDRFNLGTPERYEEEALAYATRGLPRIAEFCRGRAEALRAEAAKAAAC